MKQHSFRQNTPPLLSFLVAGLFLVLFVAGLIIFFYVIFYGALVGGGLYLAFRIKRWLFPESGRSIVSPQRAAEQSWPRRRGRGRVFEHEGD